MDVPEEFAHLERLNQLLEVPNPRDVNCHKAILYLAGLITYEELTADSTLEREQGLDFSYSKRALEISTIPFEEVASDKELITFAERMTAPGIVYVAQILDSADGELAHSNLVVNRNGSFICFDKAGFKLPFSSYELTELLAFPNYQNQKWRFVPLDQAT